jgi:alpha-glucosidase
LDVHEPHSYAVDPDRTVEPPRVHLVDAPELAIEVGGWRAVVQRSPLRIHFQSPDGHGFARDSLGPAWRGSRFGVWKRGPESARYYGAGEKAYPLERSGHYFVNWNTDAPAYGTESDPLYKSIPFFACLEPRSGAPPFAHGIFLDNSWRSYLDFGGQAVGHYGFGADGGEIAYYVFGGPTLADVLRQYTELTGRTPLPPKWALGYHQSRWSYFPDANVREIVDRFRSRSIPLDALYLDIHYMHDYRIFTWDPDRFPDHRRLLSDLRDRGIRPIIIVDPGVKSDPDYAVAREGLHGEHFVRYPDGSVYEGKVWPGACYFPDFTRPETRSWFGSWCNRALDDGVAAFWTDMNEPSNHSFRTLPDFIPHHMEGRGGTHLEAHNVYGFQMARAVFESSLSHKPDERPFVLTRAAFSGSQRFAAVWTGDNVSSWEHLALAVPMLLSLGMSGIPFAGTDVGGFFGEPSPELFVRWMQLGAFTPLFRNHSIFGSPAQEPWAFGEVAEDAARTAIELRYRLLPYLYTQFREHADSGLPVMRPLVLHYSDDPDCHTIDDQFLIGENLLVAPVLRAGAEARAVYLPRGRWFEFGTDVSYEGPQRILASAPLSEIPIFVRAGTVLPLGPVLQHVEERAVRELELEVYPGSGMSRLYEDDGRSHEYRLGLNRLHAFRTSTEGDDLRVEHVVEGTFGGAVGTFNVRRAGSRRSIPVDAGFVDVVLTGSL